MQFQKEFKEVKRKGYEAWVCKPPAGSCIINKCMNFKAYQVLGNRNYLKPQEVLELQKKNPILYNSIKFGVIGVSDFVLLINDDLYKVGFQELSANYNLINGSAISSEAIFDRAYICEEHSGVLIPTSLTYKQALHKKVADKSKCVLKWTKVLCDSSYKEVSLLLKGEAYEAFKMYLPQDQMQYFAVGTVLNNQVIPASFHFLDEVSFSYIYDCRAYRGIFNENPKVNKQPDDLFTLSKYTGGKKSFAEVIGDSIKDLYPNSIAKRFNTIFGIDVKRVTDDCVIINFSSNYAKSDFLSFAYKRGTDYFFSMEFLDIEEEPKPIPNIKEHIKSLEKSNFILIQTKDFQEYQDLVFAFLDLTSNTVISNFYTNRLTTSELKSLKQYSGRQYQNINRYLRGGECENPFESYINATFISDILDRSFVYKDFYHFRGLTIRKTLAKNIKEGYVLESNSFVSSSISSMVAGDFASAFRQDQNGYVLFFKNTFRQHGFFLDSISNHRGSEYEVLYNLNYDFKFIKKLGHYKESEKICCECWFVELVPVQGKGIKKYEYKKDAAEKLVFLIQSERRLMKDFYISSVGDADEVFVVLRIHGIDDISICITPEDDIFSVKFEGVISEEQKINIKEQGYLSVFQYIYQVLSSHKDIKLKMNKSNLASFSESFMLDLSNLFLSNNFIVLSQEINKNIKSNTSDEFDLSSSSATAGLSSDFLKELAEFNQSMSGLFQKKESEKEDDRVVSTFSIAKADLKPLEFEVALSVDTEKQEINVDLTSDDFKESISRGIRKRGSLFQEVYKCIVKSFNLDCTRRLKRIFSIVSGFYESELDFVRTGDHEYKWFVKDTYFKIELLGTKVTVSYDKDSVSFDYFTNIYQAATLVQSIV